jgi:hypothetical protein
MFTVSGEISLVMGLQHDYGAVYLAPRQHRKNSVENNLRSGQANFISWIAGRACFPRLGEKSKNKNADISISEQQEENGMIFPRLPLLRMEFE